MATPKHTTTTTTTTTTTSTTAAARTSCNTDALSIDSRISHFWVDHPRAWFVHAEATLNQQNVSDESKYNAVLAKLSKDTITQITDLILNPPATQKYETLKEKLFSIYEESENRQIQKLIGEMELGEQKPSQLLRKMQELARGRVPDNTLSVLWQGHLPPAVRTVLAVVTDKDFKNLATIADQVWETQRCAQVNEVASTSKEIKAGTPSAD